MCTVYIVFRNVNFKAIALYLQKYYWCLQEAYVIYPSFLCESKTWRHFGEFVRHTKDVTKNGATYMRTGVCKQHFSMNNLLIIYHLIQSRSIYEHILYVANPYSGPA